MSKMAALTARLFKELDLSKISTSELFCSHDQIEGCIGRHPYSHLIRRAWENLKLDAILCVDRKPTVYFKEFKEGNVEAIRALYQKFWNQGLATLLVIVTPKEIQVFSSLARPVKKGEPIDSHNRLVETLNITADILEIRQFVERVETGQIYRDNAQCFNPNLAVDQYLLKNLEYLRDLLVGDKNQDLERYKAIHVFLVRLIFTCYLTDRRIIGNKQFKAAGATDICNLRALFNNYENTDARRILFNLFEHLEGYFNGSVFDETILDDKKIIEVPHIPLIRKFLNGDELRTGQMTLGFWAYDFKNIPVETISSIYEEFLKSEDLDWKRSSGAFYTPPHLAEMVVDVATEGWDNLLDKKFLDPACGSGIFLVILFNRIVEQWQRKNPRRYKTTRANALLTIMQNQLCGVDVNETACRISCFSLCLALLDQLEPTEIHELERQQGTVLTNLLALKKDNYETAEKPVVYEGNFFDPLPISKKFDLVIGNPPWVSRGSSKDQIVLDWCASDDNPFLNSITQNKRNVLSYFVPGKQIAHAFMWKSPLHSQPRGRICLLLTSKVLFNRKTLHFQKTWFPNFKVSKIIQLSDLRKRLFVNAISPAIIIKFDACRGDQQDYSIAYEVPKAGLDEPRRGAISILPEDCKTIRLSDIIDDIVECNKTDIWKKHCWGTQRDIRLLDKLLAMPRLGEIVGRPNEGKWFIASQGFQPFNNKQYQINPKGYGKPENAWWPEDHLYLDAQSANINLVVLRDSCVKVGERFKQLHRSRDKRIYSPPMVLTNKGFTKVGYCDFPVIFQDAIYSIKGSFEDRKLLMFMAAVLKSKLAKYFQFHTSANLGVERDQVYPEEYKALPFPEPEHTEEPRRSCDIIDKIADIFLELNQCQKNRALGFDGLVEQVYTTKIEPLVYAYYSISARERFLIEDTVNISFPSMTPLTSKTKIPTVRPSSQSERQVYVHLLCEVLNSWAKRSKIRVSGSVTISDLLGLGIVTLSKTKKISPYREFRSPSMLEQSLRRIQEAVSRQVGRFSYHRGLKMFIDEHLYIVKPLALRHWTRTSALNDADEIATVILSRGEAQL